MVRHPGREWRGPLKAPGGAGRPYTALCLRGDRVPAMPPTTDPAIDAFYETATARARFLIELRRRHPVSHPRRLPAAATARTISADVAAIAALAARGR